MLLGALRKAVVLGVFVVAEGALEVDVSMDGSTGASLLDDELYTLEMTIAAQQQKLEMLRTLRQSLRLDPSTTSRSEKREYCLDLARAMDTLGCRDRREEDSGIREGSVEEKALVAEARNVTALDMLSFRVRGIGPQSFVHVLAMGYANGSVGIVDDSGETIAAMPANASSSVVAFGFDGYDSLEPTLAVGRADGNVSLFDVSLLRNGLVVAGRRRRQSPDGRDDDEVEDASRSLTNLRLSARPHGNDMQVGPTTSSSLVALDVLLSRRATQDASTRDQRPQQTKLVVAAVGRSLKLYHRNGTQTRSFDFQHTISSLKRSGNVVAVGHGPSVTLLSASKWNVVQECPDGPANVSALAFDTSSYLHAAYSSGDMLVFSTRGGEYPRKHKDNRRRKPTSSTCKLHHKLSKSAHGSKSIVGLASSRGFLISVDDSASIAIHNTTFLSGRRAPRHVYSTTASSLSVSTEKDADRKILFAGSHLLLRASSNTEVIFACLANGRLVVYESFFKYEAQQRDIGWMRMPIIFVGIVVVFAYQILRNRKPSHSPSPYYGAGGPGAAGMDADTAAFMREFSASSSGGAARRGRSRRLHDD